MDRRSISASVIAASLLSGFASACSDEDPQPDGGVVSQMDAIDDWDSGSNDVLIRDAMNRDADPPDLGTPDAGSCGCSYGFQQQCPEDEFCGRGFDIQEGQRCVRAEPFGSVAEGGCSMTASSTMTVGAACNAQCVPTSFGSPCGAIASRSVVADAIASWGQAIYNASTMAPLPGPNAMSSQDISNAMTHLNSSPECGVFVQRTVIAAVALCRGDGSVVHEPGGIHVPSTWKFRHFDKDDECQMAAGRCLFALSVGVETGVAAAAAVDEIPASCPNSLPYGAPCQGPDAQRCLRARIESMIRALNED